MKTIDERELQKNNGRKISKGRKEQNGHKLNDFVVHLS